MLRLGRSASCGSMTVKIRWIHEGAQRQLLSYLQRSQVEHDAGVRGLARRRAPGCGSGLAKPSSSRGSYMTRMLERVEEGCSMRGRPPYVLAASRSCTHASGESAVRLAGAQRGIFAQYHSGPPPALEHS